MMQQIFLGSGAVVVPAPDSVSYSILSGGGSGHTSGGNCAGGAGAIPVQGTFAPTATSYSVTVGAGGTGGSDGSQSSIGGIANGSPGGGASSCNPGGNNASYSGNNGSIFAGGGGAGAGGNATGAGGDLYAGNGGVGVVMPLHPTGLRVGGGGAGANPGGYPKGTAVDGGGTTQTSGASNRGGGGGNNASGGSGRVILRYSDEFPEASTTGSVNTSQSGGFRTYDFISNGTITF